MLKKMKHTPGPWAASISSLNNLWVYSDKRPICVVPITRGIGETPYENSPQTLADARLIAAAPELLEALKRLWACAGEFEEDSLAAALDQAADAIAKAKGK